MKLSCRLLGHQMTFVPPDEIRDQFNRSVRPYLVKCARCGSPIYRDELDLVPWLYHRGPVVIVIMIVLASIVWGLA